MKGIHCHIKQYSSTLSKGAREYDVGWRLGNRIPTWRSVQTQGSDVITMTIEGRGITGPMHDIIFIWLWRPRPNNGWK